VQKISLRHFIGILLFCASVILGIWSYYPLEEQDQLTDIPGIGQQRLIWTPIIRSGDVKEVKLEFSSDDKIHMINSFINDRDDEIVPTKPIIFGKTHHVLIEARLEMPGLEILQYEEISQPFNQGDNLNFIWQIVPEFRNYFSGEVWLYIHLLPLESGIDIRRPVLIRGVTIQSIDLLGLNIRIVKRISIIGIGLAFILWSDMVGKIINKLFNRNQEI
jgi:hypothetical protein